jgi:hypothetical protein
MTGQLELVQHVNLQRPKTAAEVDVLRGRDLLIAKHQHVIVEMRAVNACEIFGGKRLVQIEAEHFGADGRIERNDFERPARASRLHARRGVLRGRNSGCHAEYSL